MIIFSRSIIVVVLCLIGKIQAVQGQSNYLDSLLQQFENTRATADQKKIKKLVQEYVQEQIDIASDKSNEGSFNESIKLKMAALETYKTIGDRLGEGKTLASISYDLFFQKESQQGIQYGLEAIDILKNLDDPSALAYAYDQVGSHYISTGEYDQAIDMLKKSVSIVERISAGTIDHAIALNSRGNAYKNAGRFQPALADYLEAQRITTEADHRGGMSATTANVSDIYIRQAKWTEALPHQLKSVELMEETGFYANATENYQNLSRIYENLGDYDNALKYLYKHNYAKDSLITEQQEKAVRELNTKYETEQRESTIAQQKEKITQQSLLQKLGIAIIGLLGLFLFQLFRNFKNKKVANEKMEAANKLLEKKNLENELLLKEIHHRVKNNLQTISSLLSLQSESMEDQAAIDAVQESQNRVASMALIHQKLYQGKNLASIEMQNYFKTMGRAVIDGFGQIANDVDLKVDMQPLEMDVDMAIPIGLITNELMTNSLKYAFPDKKGQITIRLKTLENNLYELVVEDDGVGQSNAAKSKNDGFGSLLVNLLSAQIQGQMEVDTDNGTAVRIAFPPMLKSAV